MQYFQANNLHAFAIIKHLKSLTRENKLCGIKLKVDAGHVTNEVKVSLNCNSVSYSCNQQCFSQTAVFILISYQT